MPTSHSSTFNARAWALIKWLFDPTIVASVILVVVGGLLLAKSAEKENRQHQAANLRQVFLVDYTRSIAALTAGADRLGELPSLWAIYEKAPEPFRSVVFDDVKTIHQSFNTAMLESNKAHIVLSAQLLMSEVAGGGRPNEEPSVSGPPTWSSQQLAMLVKTASNQYIECCLGFRARQEEGIPCSHLKDELNSRLEALQACIAASPDNDLAYCPDLRPPKGDVRMTAGHP